MIERTMRCVVDEVVRGTVHEAINKTVEEIVDRKLEEKLKPFYEFAEGTTSTLGHILDELQKVHGQKLDARVRKLESLHPGNHHASVMT